MSSAGPIWKRVNGAFRLGFRILISQRPRVALALAAWVRGPVARYIHVHRRAEAKKRHVCGLVACWHAPAPGF